MRTSWPGATGSATSGLVEPHMRPHRTTGGVVRLRQAIFLSRAPKSAAEPPPYAEPPPQRRGGGGAGREDMGRERVRARGGGMSRQLTSKTSRRQCQCGYGVRGEGRRERRGGCSPHHPARTAGGRAPQPWRGRRGERGRVEHPSWDRSFSCYLFLTTRAQEDKDDLGPRWWIEDTNPRERKKKRATTQTTEKRCHQNESSHNAVTPPCP